MTKPPEELISPYYKKDGMLVQSNVSGKYRKCEDTNCETYVSCPYVRCFAHWTAMRRKAETDMKEYK